MFVLRSSSVLKLTKSDSHQCAELGQCTNGLVVQGPSGEEQPRESPLHKLAATPCLLRRLRPASRIACPEPALEMYGLDLQATGSGIVVREVSDGTCRWLDGCRCCVPGAGARASQVVKGGEAERLGLIHVGDMLLMVDDVRRAASPSWRLRKCCALQRRGCDCAEAHRGQAVRRCNRSDQSIGPPPHTPAPPPPPIPSARPRRAFFLSDPRSRLQPLAHGSARLSGGSCGGADARHQLHVQPERRSLPIA